MGPQPLNELLSSIFGYISIASWLVVFLPQIYENYSRKSAESLSLTFILIWLLGDIANLIGGIWQHVLDTMIYLAVYYTIADVILLFQMFYYRRKMSKDQDDEPRETTSLLNTQASKPKKKYRRIYFILKTFGIIFLGIFSWYFAFGSHNHENIPTPIPEEPTSEPKFEISAQILGWTSAVLYLGSRIPQIIKNFRKKSCQGLSLAMFCFSLLGNVTYCTSIFIKSVDPKYLSRNLPWILGSGGTILFDMIIFFQFYLYRKIVEEDNVLEA